MGEAQLLNDSNASAPYRTGAQLDASLLNFVLRPSAYRLTQMLPTDWGFPWCGKSKAMYSEGMWIRSELFTRGEMLIGSVRIRHGPDWSLGLDP